MKKEKLDLTQLRKKIDFFDKELITALSKRMKTVNTIGEYKKEQGLKPLDKKRWQTVLKSRIVFGKTAGLPPALIEKLFNLIHKYSLLIQKNKKQ